MVSSLRGSAEWVCRDVFAVISVPGVHGRVVYTYTNVTLSPVATVYPCVHSRPNKVETKGELSRLLVHY